MAFTVITHDKTKSELVRQLERRGLLAWVGKDKPEIILAMTDAVRALVDKETKK